MANATCSANNIGFNWPASWGSSGVLKIISDREFVSNGYPYPAGRISDPIDQNFCYQSAITVVSDVATFAAITLPQTDALDVQVVNGSGTPRYTAIIYSNGGKTKRQNLFASWHLSASLGTSFNFTAWATDNNAPSVVNPRSQWVDIDTLNRALAAIAYAPATVTQLGLTKMSTTPVDTSNPIAVGKNDYASSTNNGIARLSTDPNLAAVPTAYGVNDQHQPSVTTPVYYLSQFSSFLTALTFIGITDTATLVVDKLTAVGSSSVSVNANCILDWTGAGGLTLTTGRTLTIKSDTSNYPMRQIFYNATGSQGKVLSGAGAIGQCVPQWWGATGDGVTVDYGAVQAASDFAFGPLGSEHNANSKLNLPLYFPEGTYNLGANTWSIRNLRGARISGAGNTSTLITSTGTAALAIDGFWYSHVSDMAFYGTATYAGGVVEINGTVGGSISEQYTTWINVFFSGQSFTADAFQLNITGGGSGQGDGNLFLNCRWSGGTVSGYHQSGANTLNNQIIGGDVQSCPNYGIWIDGQSTIGTIDGTSFENGNNVADIYIAGGVTQSKSSVSNIRSESKVFVVGVGAAAPIELNNIEAAGYGWVGVVNGNVGVSDWAANTAVTTSKYTIGDGRLFKITTAGTTGGSEPTWSTCLSDGGTLADGTAVWTQQEWNIVDINNSSIDHCFFGLGRVNVNLETGDSSLRTAINDLVVSRTDWAGGMGVGSQGLWLGNPASQYALSVQVRKMTWAIPQWEVSPLVSYGNRANTLSWSVGNRALQPKSYNPFFIGDGTFIFSKAVSAGLGFADVGIGHGAPDSGGNFNSTSADADYLTQNTLGIWGTIAPGRIPVGSNQQGQDLYIEGGPSTGNLASGAVYLRAGVAGAGGAQVNPTANVASVDSTALSALKRFVQIEGAALTVGSNTIAPTHSIHQVGAGLIKTITVPSGFTSGTIAFVPTAAFTYDATGNVLGTGTAVIGRTMFATYSSSTSKWSMSY